jgi:hypothetical protein
VIRVVIAFLPVRQLCWGRAFVCFRQSEPTESLMFAAQSKNDFSKVKYAVANFNEFYANKENS